jgi:hypothetical protein
MGMLQDGFKLNLDLFTDATNGINKAYVLTDAYDHIWNLVSATLTEYNTATNKVDLTSAIEGITSNEVENVLEAQGAQNYQDYISGDWNSTDCIKMTDGLGVTYWKAHYLTAQTITFGSATASEFGGSISANNLPLTYTITGGQTVQAILLGHNSFDESVTITVAQVTDSNDYQYSIDTLSFTNS